MTQWISGALNTFNCSRGCRSTILEVGRMGTVSARPLLTSLWDKHELYSVIHFVHFITHWILHTHRFSTRNTQSYTDRKSSCFDFQNDGLDKCLVLNACLFSSVNGQFYDQINNVTSHIWLIDFSPSRHWTQHRHKFHPPLSWLPTAELSTAEWLVSIDLFNHSPTGGPRMCSHLSKQHLANILYLQPLTTRM